MGAVYSIPAGEPFAPTLAAGLLAVHGVAGLARVRLLLPSRRACLVMREAFLLASGGAPLLLPRLVPVGDAAGEMAVVDPDVALALPPELDDLRRRLLLTELVRAQDPELPDEQAFRLADDLAVLLDELAVEDVALDRLGQLDLSEAPGHAQEVGRFLGLLAAHWPAILAAEGATGRMERRRRSLELVAERWRDAPPGPVVLAGVTGSVQAVAELAVTVAALPEGQVVLPGLDPDLDEAAWAALPASHPQWGFGRLLALLGRSAAEVQPWPYGPAPRPRLDRRRLLARMANPAGWTAPPLDAGAALAGVGLQEAPDLGTEALAIALTLRDLLDDPERTALVVTPDRQLARRVAAELQRFGVRIEDSAGQPLDQSAPGNFLLLAAHAWLDPDPVVPLLATLKHPLARGGASAGFCRAAARTLERRLRRAGSTGRAWPALAEAAAAEPELAPWFDRLVEAGAPLAELAGAERAAPADLLAAHLALVDWLVRDDLGSDAELWAGLAGAELERFLAGAAEAFAGIGPIAATAYPPILATAMAGVAVRRPHVAHPQIEILGRFESRLASADLVILAGLNEGVWPAPPEPGPWLGRAQRHALGLPPIEQHVGYAAHDFVQLAASAPRLVLSRSRRDAAGAPTASSRWLSQLERALASAGAPLRPAASPTLAWAEAFDRWPGPAEPRPRPEPRPPLRARPERLAVSDVERLIHNPYAVYAQRVLGLRPLDPIARPVDAADRGTLIHAVLEEFVRAHPTSLPADAEQRLLALGRAAFDRARLGDAVVALWWPRFCRLAAWFVELELARRAAGLEVLAECEGSLELPLDGQRSVWLKGRIDRLERHPDGRLEVHDYKTGNAPKPKEVADGLRPQLPLLGAIVGAGAIPAVSALAVSRLCYLELKGAEPPGVLRAIEADDTAGLIQATLEGVLAMLRAYADPKAPYLPIPRPAASPYPEPFAPLSRDQEWLDAEARP
ncbi:MAG: double-strand break repair protein AddB [Geminicoccaceae bacterium]|nr:MAG: double-strand break repair protein AddB [Geminicoccaceae bacterium]